ncbi:mitochondrial tRNA-specific 2-thiouridylase 1 isoform X1 [Bombus pyrosoma]|uniref:mitochondrial tRNA-specific 2-thiouridylase 1 isoform X1 n=2 Tax=Bombus pyrosoma TaxID=396416 RepID=UPI001CB96413|nr:mitochondrial tRNA-specific 2-thiouridylase 1 isoform X1 [Bombus pyrosoma]XP_043597521.1 mitochondrial tRNA-specific 2-thiouridylase 1 isoform X1 [Bombus pyrosoma]XP_043597523.1 mitochondrial tRNA-specific 2-thiouridylase 1 isoform X1 [Bombus pyrosoma]XP_043597524.1 mitochondrial tRNA-specific 2-thiouridylase 1 isoform X1 [Bombus pyrosoma]XP_043597525.1 mitochondrial tRNA-specific 2-thiouridylase 1 isoform X1 [Bombus pyrosoma]XP_043597526.1 mitochondrial tRNA-specific 2-thiouridylase 1 isof
MFKKVIVGISGGVDSAVSALLLKNKGFNVTGVFMKNWDIKDETGICQTEEDYEDAQWVCKKLDIPLVEVNFVKEYWNNIFSYLTEQYENGYTPNPDILCNKYIKFDHFFNFARTKLQADAIATGHYVRTSFGSYLEHFKTDTNVSLFQARDPGKDQTFFLCQVPQQALRYSMFPLGEYLKKDVKQIAQKAGLDKVALKRESRGICFVGKRNFQNFISEYISDKPGDFVDLDDGRVVGKHMGFHHWTIGQNIKISGLPAAYYVYKKDINTNNIIVVKGTHNSALYSEFIITGTPYWISSEPEFNSFSRLLNCDLRFQHRDPLVSCTVHKNLKNQLIIQLSQPLRALTEGQFITLYNGEECLGSAVISYCGPSYYSLNQEVKMDHYRRNTETQKQIADASM